MRKIKHPFGHFFREDQLKIDFLHFYATLGDKMASSQSHVFSSAAERSLNVAGVASSGDQRIDGLIEGDKWNGAITYGDPAKASEYGASFPEKLTNFSQLSTAQLRVAQAALDTAALGQPKGAAGFSVEGFTDLSVSYDRTGSALLALANTSDPATAYGYFPSEEPIGGDAFFGSSGRNPVVGNYDYQTILHELGHTLGLKHGQEAGLYGALPDAVNSHEYSVMTYDSYIGSPGKVYSNELWGGPQTYMMLDIAALQHMYGADFTTNAGNTVYSWSPSTGQTLVDGLAALTPGGNRILMTVWDGGGTDTYDLSSYATNLNINLRPGEYSVFSATQLAGLGGGPNDGHARGNVFNALQYEGDARSLIENAIGGSGRDTIIGNAAANKLIGNAGGDYLNGDAGADVLRGGAGNDTLIGANGADVLIGGAGTDTFRFLSGNSQPGALDSLRSGDGGAAFDGAGAAGGDRIDLRGIDANTSLAGDQAFQLGTTHGIGHLWLSESGTNTMVNGNVDGDAALEFQLAINDGATRASVYSAADFLL